MQIMFEFGFRGGAKLLTDPEEYDVNFPIPPIPGYMNMQEFMTHSGARKLIVVKVDGYTTFIIPEEIQWSKVIEVK